MIIGLVLVALGSAGIILWYVPHKMNRFYALGGYGHAYQICCIDKGLKAPTLEVIEKTNNAADSRKRFDLPVEPNYKRPIYRPIALKSDEMFLIFIEMLPDDAWLDDRWVVFATPNGERIQIEWLGDGELAQALIDDDLRRARNSVP